MTVNEYKMVLEVITHPEFGVYPFQKNQLLELGRYGQSSQNSIESLDDLRTQWSLVEFAVLSTGS